VILVTAVAGSVGRVALRRLLALGHHVAAMARRSRGLRAAGERATVA
jgi:uncharacterized protein YbjT (DUF2867 family)